MGSLIKIFKATIAAILICCLTACAVKLAPEYDKAIVTGITSVNQKMMELFASTSSGVEAATYEKREGQYNAIIGMLDALAIQSEARPEVENTTIGKIISYIIPSRNKDILDKDEKQLVPSTNALNKLSFLISEMRDTDKQKGISKTLSAREKEKVSLYIDQALTYESFLER